MARKKTPTLTDSELRLMEILWEKGTATVGEIVEALPKRSSVAYSTVLTTMRILEQKGYVEHSKEGRAFVYRPLINRVEARRNILKYILSRFFDNSPELLVVNILKQEKIDEEELSRLKKMVKESE
ncbi:MAG: BlaI/MecI/CopY family transcriptional regulator [Acidobacteriota bacterium]